MNGSLVPIRLVIIMAIVITGCLFLFGLLHWNSKKLSCFGGNHWYGDWYVVYSVGKLEFRQKQYGCPAEDRYDPKQFKTDTIGPQ
jgi:hypothetical protein